MNFQVDRVPFETCITCRQLGKLDESRWKPVPTLYNFESILVKPSIRFSFACDSLLCKIAKLILKKKNPLSKPQDSTPKGGQKQPSLTTEKRCTLCLSLIGRGISHRCTPGIRHDNLRRMAKGDLIGAE